MLPFRKDIAHVITLLLPIILSEFFPDSCEKDHCAGFFAKKIGQGNLFPDQGVRSSYRSARSFDIADFPAAVFALDGIPEIIHILDKDKMTAILYDVSPAQLTEHAVETFARRRRIIGQFLIRQRNGDQDSAVYFLAIAVGQPDQCRIKRPFLAIKQEIAEFGMLFAHMCAHDLQQIDRKHRLLFQIALQYGKFDSINLRGALGNRVENIHRIFS